MQRISLFCHFHIDNCLFYASKPLHVATSSLYEQFNDDYVCSFSSCYVFFCSFYTYFCVFYFSVSFWLIKMCSLTYCVCLCLQANSASNPLCVSSGQLSLQPSVCVFRPTQPPTLCVSSGQLSPQPSAGQKLNSCLPSVDYMINISCNCN